MGYPMGLRDYVRVYEGVVGQDECARLVELVSGREWELHSFYNSKDEQVRFSKELSTLYLGSEAVSEVQAKLWNVLHSYICRDLAFMSSWFDGWAGFSQIRFNRYEAGTQMRRHCDHIHTLFSGNPRGIPILSILGALNDDYEGGELLFWDGERIELKAGSVMVFPSNFMYPHEVREVTRGTRYSFVSWAW